MRLATEVITVPLEIEKLHDIGRCLTVLIIFSFQFPCLFGV